MKLFSSIFRKLPDNSGKLSSFTGDAGFLANRALDIYNPILPPEVEDLKKAVTADKTLLEKITPGGSNMLQIAAALNNIELAGFLIDSGINLNHQDKKNLRRCTTARFTMPMK